MKPPIIFVTTQLEPSKMRDLKPERVAQLGGAIFEKIVAETSGPVEGLAVLRIAARLVREMMTKSNIDADTQQEIVQMSGEIAQGINTVIASGSELPMMMSPGGES